MMTAPAQAIPISVVNENSKYAGSVVVKKAGPPPARKMAGAIDVIGGGNLSSRRPESGVSPAPSMEEQPEVVININRTCGLMRLSIKIHDMTRLKLLLRNHRCQ